MNAENGRLGIRLRSGRPLLKPHEVMTHAEREERCIERFDVEAWARYMCPRLFALRNLMEIDRHERLGDIQRACRAVVRLGNMNPMQWLGDDDIADVSLEAFDAHPLWSDEAWREAA